jgi:hypothetical protein
MTEYSDYYHYNQSGEYREVRKPYDDFGKELIRDFDQHDWNSFINTLAVACQSFIQHGYVSSGDDNMRVNAYRNKIGVQMIEWFDVFFNASDETVDNFLPRIKVYEMYKIDTGSDITSNGFGTKLRDYAAMKAWAYNPPAIERHRTNDGRVIAKQSHVWSYSVRDSKWQAVELIAPKAVEFFYMQTSDKLSINYTNIEEFNPVNSKAKDPMAALIEERNKGPKLF